jgi:hypothetical protein
VNSLKKSFSKASAWLAVRLRPYGESAGTRTILAANGQGKDKQLRGQGNSLRGKKLGAGEREKGHEVPGKRGRDCLVNCPKSVFLIAFLGLMPD